MAAAGFISVRAVFWGGRKPMVQCRYYVINLRILRSMEKIHNAFCFLFGLGLGWAGLCGSSLYPLGISAILSKIGEVCYIKLKDKGLSPFFSERMEGFLTINKLS